MPVTGSRLKSLKEMSNQDNFRRQVKAIYGLMMVLLALMGVTAAAVMILLYNPGMFDPSTEEIDETYVLLPEEEDFDKVENGIHVRTGLVEAEGLMAVVNNCTNCHSAQLITQNRMNEERWIATIRWMQETQNLWDLGKNEEIIVNYLVTNYPVTSKGRRAPLMNIEWYELQD